MHGNVKDLTGMRFGKLVVVRPTDKRRCTRVVWECRCDCGNLTYVRSDNLVQGKTKSCGCITSALDITGLRFGKLVAIEPTDLRSGKHVVWKCLCDCGNFTFVNISDLTRGHTKSCGCVTTAIDITGRVFGRLTAVEPTDKKDNGSVVWKCVCVCGKFTLVSVRSLSSGNTKSCGCLRKDIMSARKGILSPSWNHTLTNKERSDKRRYPEYYKWRADVYLRDDYTCQKCGNKTGTLNAHHIEGYADNRGLRTELSNGITLCEDCHNNFHSIYRRKHASKKEFEEWISD